jgi:capsular polysaccharide biosynthesis protein
MNNNEKITIKDVLKRWRLILLSMIVFALFAFIISGMLPAKYQSDISVIVVQKQSSEKIDAFSATKSAEFLSNIFTRVIYTTSFFNDVQNAPFEVRRDFPRDSEEREKEWKKFITVKKINNTGIINISIFDESRKTAEETAKAVAYILTTDSEKYHGGGERVTVRLIDGPNTPLKPTVPKIVPNTIIGGIFGGMIAVVFIYFFPNKLCLSEKKSKEINKEEYDSALQENKEVSQTHFNNSLKQGLTEENYPEIEEYEKKCEEISDKEIVEKNEEFNSEVEELHNRISDFNKN